MFREEQKGKGRAFYAFNSTAEAPKRYVLLLQRFTRRVGDDLVSYLKVLVPLGRSQDGLTPVVEFLRGVKWLLRFEG